MKGKFDRDATYKVAFKNDDAQKDFWIHMHCLMVPDTRAQHGGDDENYIEYLQRQMYKAYQVMDLYDAVQKSGRAFGGFLNLIREIDPEVLKNLKTEKIEEV
jgi:hypothetical protein